MIDDDAPTPDVATDVPAPTRRTRRPRRSTTPVELPSTVQHGTLLAYNSYACGCDDCRDRMRRRVGDRRRDLATRRVNVRGFMVTPDAPHGTLTGYVNWVCRCGPCRGARRDASS